MLEFIKRLPQTHYGLKKLIKLNYKKIDFDKLDTSDIKSDETKIKSFYMQVINEILYSNPEALEMLNFLSVINTTLKSNIDKKILKKSFKNPNMEEVFNVLLETKLIKAKESKEDVYEFCFPYLQEVLAAKSKDKFHKHALQYYEIKSQKLKCNILDDIEILFHKVELNPSEKLINEFLTIANKIIQYDESHKKLVDIALKLLKFDDKYKAPILFVLGNILSIIGNPEDAEKIYISAIDIYGKLAKKYYKIYLPYVATTQKNLGTLYTDLKRFEEAEKMYSNALESYKEIERNYYDVHSPDFEEKEYSIPEESFIDDIKAYAKLLEKNYDIYLPEEPSTEKNLGNVCIDLDLLEDIQDGSIDSLDNYKKLAKMCYDMYLVDIAKTQSNLGIVYTNLRRYEEAEKMHLKALKIKKKVADLYPDQVLSELAYSYLDLGDLYASINRFEEAEPMFKEALDSFKRLVDANPEIYMYNIALIQNSLGIIYTRLQKYDLAEQRYFNALEIFKNYSRKDNKTYKYNVADVQNNLGNLYLILRDLNKAQKYLNKAFKIDPTNTIILYNFACLESLKNNHAKALEILSKLIELDNDVIDRVLSDDKFDNIKELKEFKELIGE